MRLLLDSHAFYWWDVGSDLLSPAAFAAIRDPRHEKLVSAATAWELAIKYAGGKEPGFARLAVGAPAVMRAHGFAELPISAVHATAAGALPLHHRDPFDRMLIAQARTEAMTLVSCDAIFDRYGVSRLW